MVFFLGRSTSKHHVEEIYTLTPDGDEVVPIRHTHERAQSVRWAVRAAVERVLGPLAGPRSTDDVLLPAQDVFTEAPGQMFVPDPRGGVAGTRTAQQFAWDESREPPDAGGPYPVEPWPGQGPPGGDPGGGGGFTAWPGHEGETPWG